MSPKKTTQVSKSKLPRGRIAAVALVGIAGLLLAKHAQGQMDAAQMDTARATPLVAESSSLPDDPGATMQKAGQQAATADRQARAGTRMASTVDKIIETGESAPHLDMGDKVLLGVRASVSLFTVAGWLGSSLYSITVNTSPNYTRDGKGFAQRLGASAARSTSEDLFADALFAPVLHEDPRYYEMGAGHSTLRRATYAITRVVVTRRDSGAETPNGSLLLGNLAGSALTQLYYPSVNRSVGQVAKTWGGSLGGSAFGFLLDEFFTPEAERLGLKRRPR